jgi:type VII secretion protein EssB
MPELILRRTIHNSELVIAKDKRVFLTYPSEGMAACTLLDQEDGIDLVFESADLDLAEAIFSSSEEDRFRFLANCAALEDLDVEYFFSLSLDNLLVDMNLRPRILVRDSRRIDDIDFITRYKALLGSVLQHRYQYADYLNGGESLYLKNSFLSEIAEMDAVDTIRGRLVREYDRITRTKKQTKRLVPTRNVWASRVILPVLAVALIAVGYLALNSVFREVPFRNDIIQANTEYIAGNYIGVQQSLSKYGVTDLSYETKYFLSRAFVSTEALTTTQKDNILVVLTLKTDSVIFDYWIHVGRMDFENAIDIAQRLSDGELLLFAYMKYEVMVRNDTAMSGAEKATLLDDLNEKIDALEQARVEIPEDDSGPR